MTNPADRFHPTYLRQWIDFPRLQQEVYSNVFSLFPGHQGSPFAPFTSRIKLRDLGRDFCCRILASESDVQILGRMTIENDVRHILAGLQSIPGSSNISPNNVRISFENHSSVLSETLDAQGGTTRSKTMSCCVHREVNGRNELLTIIEYKPPHKLSPEHLRAGLLPMNLVTEIVQSPGVPVNHGERLQYVADMKVAAVATQAFDAMIKDGIAYACVMTGVGQVFLPCSKGRS